MELHRTGKKADWELIPARDWNAWQRLAARTHKVVTPGNIVSLLGLATVFAGLWFVAQQHLWAGLILIAAGRVLDIVDGMVADRTGTKSHIGEGIDAGFDKIVALAAFIVLASSHILPLVLAVGIGGLSVITALFSLSADIFGKTVHPNIVGKLGTFVLWGALPGFVLGKATHAGWITCIATALAAMALALSTAATLHYMYGTLRGRRE
jgi:phosphatidylglycerophosphate synthase